MMEAMKQEDRKGKELLPAAPPSSESSHIDDVSEKLSAAFLKQASQLLLHDIAKIAGEHDPIDLAYAVTRLPRAARIIVYENLPDLNSKATFMINTNSTTRSAVFDQLSDDDIRELIDHAPPDEVVWILDDMSDRRIRRILDQLELHKAATIRELQKHDRHSAGRLMTSEYFSFAENTTVGEAAAFIRDNPGIELTRFVFVVDKEGKLTGCVLGRNLIATPDYLPLRHIMRPILHKVQVETSRDDVVDLVERYKVPSLPVVDADDKLVGVITYEDVVEAMKDIADETIANIAGTAEDVSEHEPIIKRFFWRAPWLLVTLCAGLVTATAMNHFSERLWFAFIPFFVPLITGMSGNVGIQCSTILVRGMSTGELTPGSRTDAIGKELMIGMLIGTVFGVISGLAIYLLNHFGIHHVAADPIAIGITVSFGLFGACMTATTLGALSPFFFERFGIDPAVASGPIVTAFNDVLSTLIFFLVASQLSGLLL